MKKKFRVTLGIIFVLIISFGLLFYFSKKDNKEDVVYTDIIENYGYTLSPKATALYKEHFYELKEMLESNSFKKEDYVKKVSMLFIIDLYTLSNKDNKYDVGGTEFIHPEFIENYSLKVKDTIYKYLNTEKKKDRVEVKSIKITNFEEEEDNYIINLSWKYNKDKEYDNISTIKIIELDNKMYIVEHEGAYESIN